MKMKSKDERADELRPEYDLAILLKEGVQGWSGFLGQETGIYKW